MGWAEDGSRGEPSEVTVDSAGGPVGGCQVWGVLNLTPDSFSDGGLYMNYEVAVGHARDMLVQGAHVIDVGGESTRPRGKTYGQGASPVAAEEEAERVVPVIRTLTEELGAHVSVDTQKPEVAEQAISAGARIVNDVSGGASRELLNVVARTEVELVLMHNRGRGEITPQNTSYGNVVRDVTQELMNAVDRALEAGVARKRIWVDPGIGFAKTAQQSLMLLAHLEELVALGHRVLVGPSRKSFVAEVAPKGDSTRPPPAERQGGTAAAVTAAVLGGAHAVRVHDVAAMRQAVLVAEAIAASRRTGTPAKGNGPALHNGGGA